MERRLNAKTGEVVTINNPEPPTFTASSIRDQRDALLTASDWTQASDAPVDRSAWATYRQALRDVPDQAGFPDNVTWPQRPA